MAAVLAKKSFSSLPEEVQEQIREKQRQAQAKKKAKKSSHGPEAPAQPIEVERTPERTHLTMEEYFGACRAGVFQQQGFRASEEMVEHLLSLDFNQVVGRFRDGSPVRLASFNYFLFDGSDQQIWDPIFLARLAYEGFFTITTGRGRDRKPLPELQPYYGVLDWKNFSLSKPVKKALKRAKTRSEDAPSVGVRYYLYCNRNFQLTYQGINEYHKDQHGENWMTWKYLEAFKRASDNPTINFHLHSIELYDGPLPENGDAASAPKLVAGEIGYSIGKIYTSLSGFNLRGEDGVGWIQLSCLGKWLEQKNYSFWSLGHCYSPQMEYKRQLGHRIYTREEFLQRLKLERGDFRLPEGTPDFVPLDTAGEACDMNTILSFTNTDESLSPM